MGYTLRSVCWLTCLEQTDFVPFWAYSSLMFWFPSSRRGHDDLGDHYLDCGDLSNALKCYSRARDYCTSAKHVINMCLNVIKVGRFADKGTWYLLWSCPLYLALVSAVMWLMWSLDHCLSMPAPHYFWLSAGQCLPPELVSCPELCEQGWVYTRNCRSKLLLFELYNFSLCFLFPKFVKWFLPFPLYDFSHDICVQNLTCGKNRYFLSSVLPYFPRQIRLSYLDIEIGKLIIEVKYPGDSCKQTSFHTACSLMLCFML